MTKLPDAADDSASSSDLPFMTRRAVLQGMNAAVLGLGVGAGTIATSAVGQAIVETNVSPARTGPRKVRDLENVWIPMRDGTKLAARIWLPEDAEQSPVPALIEYIPYRKRDFTRLGNETNHPHFASHGYACVRPDIRGSGDSEGPVQDEYIPQEQEDGLDIIAWLAKQPWCTGKVGMFGISWGGFSALQVAARRPPGLKAIITHCSTDDRYTDDAHYSGGTINECMFVWGSMHTTNTPRPPDPEIVGPRWRDMWRERLESLDFYVGDWLAHQHRDDFWKHASINEDYGQIECAVYAVGGWADPYQSTIPRMLSNLKVPRKGLVGPWGHQYPNEGWPGPAIDWLSEALRWWDYWLKGIDTGIMNEPMYRVWMQHEPCFQGTMDNPGRWVAETTWPSSRIRMETYHLTQTGLQRRAGGAGTMVLYPEQTVGFTAPYWYATVPIDLPADQRMDDARSLVFDSPALDQPVEILGAAVVNIDVAVDKPVAFLIVRLCELTPDNISRRVTYGVLNLCHRDGHESPRALEPGKRYRIRLPLRDVAHAFKAGSKLRIALSTTYWPMIWPSPEPVTLTVFTGQSTLELPSRPPLEEDAQLREFGAAFTPKSSGVTELVPGGDRSKTYEWDIETQTLTIRTDNSYQRSRLNATGTELSSSWREVSIIREGDPTSARLEHYRSNGLHRPDWDVRVDTVLRLALTKDTFLLEGEVATFEDGKPFWSRKWQRPILRKLV